jgi:iron uptake system component EfeO
VSRFVRPAQLVAVALGAIGIIAACSGAPASAGPATPVPSNVVAVEAAKDGPYKFTPSTILVPAGTVTFSVRNAGNEEHEFEIFKGETVVDEIEGLVPGLTKQLTVTLAAGDYTFACKLNGHDQLGMKGTLTVQ